MPPLQGVAFNRDVHVFRERVFSNGSDPEMTDTIVKAVGLARDDAGGATPGPGARRRVSPVVPAGIPVRVATSVMERNRLVSGMKDQRVLDAYSLLRSRILHRVKQNNITTLGITSPSPRDGKSLTATNLAISIALGENLPVLLVDADVRRPSIADLFHLNINVGLGDYLVDDAELDEMILQPPINGLYFVPGRAKSRLRPEALSSDKVTRLIGELKQRVPGGLIICDMPPALVGGDVVAFAPNLDATLLVVADRRTQEADMEKVMPLMEGVNVIGTVLNFADQTVSKNDYYGGR